ncbi:MAG TPA: hypothetical protein VFX47_04865, partial [Gammaproteobacteria bacterium]|nr:hypothetical protein [Gammaproteobacteria bacterium]
EEVTLPLAEHRRRQGLAANTLMAEGSDWLLLQTTGEGRPQLRLQRFAEFSELHASLRSAWHDGGTLCCARSMEQRMADTLQQVYGSAVPSGPQRGFHDSLEKVSLTEFVVEGRQGDLFLADGDTERGWSLFHLGA